MLTFKDFLVAPVEGVDEYIQYRNKKRRNGAIGESVDPCWKGYKQIGTKTKDGKEVPNCVPEENDLEEAILNPQQRMKKKQQMRRLKNKLKLGRQRAMKKRAGLDKLKKRAQKRARAAMFAKFAKGKGKEELSYSERKQIEKRLESKKSMIARMAKRLLPKVKKDDQTKQKIIGNAPKS